MTLREHAQSLVHMVQNFKQLTGEVGEAMNRRIQKARDIIRQARDKGDNSVSFWIKRHESQVGLAAHLRVDASNIHHVIIGSNGWHHCSCPDHNANSMFCKHLMALSAVAAKQVR